MRSNAGKLSPEERRAISQKSCGLLGNLGPQIQWVQSYVTDDKVYRLLHRAEQGDGAGTRKASGFLADRISEVKPVI